MTPKPPHPRYLEVTDIGANSQFVLVGTRAKCLRDRRRKVAEWFKAPVLKFESCHPVLFDRALEYDSKQFTICHFGHATLAVTGRNRSLLVIAF